MKKNFLILKLSSQKGIFLTLIALPLMILAVGFSLGIFLVAINSSNQTRILYNRLQAQYNASKGIEYAYVEIKNQNFGTSSFETHDVSLASATYLDLIPKASGSLPIPKVTAAEVVNDGTINAGVYELSGPGHKNDFQAKVYSLNEEIYVMSKGTSAGQTRLFIKKLSGTSLFDYLAFYPGNASLGWGTLDAKGGRIHANGDIILNHGAIIQNASEVSTPAAMKLGYYAEVKSGDEGLQFTSRSPFWTPNYDDPVPANDNYLNTPDHHFMGDSYNLYKKDTAGVFSTWNGTTLGAGETLVYPWGSSTEVGVLNPPLGTNWYNGSDLSWIYQNQNPNCQSTGTCGTINNEDYDYTFNSNLNHYLPYINGYYLPNRLTGSYTTYRYTGRTTASDPQIPINLTNSATYDPDNRWKTFIDTFDKVYGTDSFGVDDITQITGLKGVVKAGTANNGKYITPPTIDVGSLITSAKSSGSGLAIAAPDALGNTLITINGGTSPITISSSTPVYKAPSDCGLGSDAPLFTKKTFINDQSGLTNDVIEVNMGNLMACEALQTGQWIPTNKLMYSNYGLALTNAIQLPVGGLTTIVSGNLILKGDFNTAEDLGTGTWQPSAAVVSNQVYLTSDGFTYPATLPYTQHHPSTPYEGWYYYGASSSGHPDGMDCSGDQGNSLCYHVPAANATNTPDFTSDKGGFNWLYNFESGMPNKVTDSSNPLKRTEHNYNISLIGPYAYGPRMLERWNYNTDAGTATTAPSIWITSHTAVVKGAFVQLTADQFSRVEPFDTPNNRQCTQTPGQYAITFPPGYPCRRDTAPGNTWDLLASGVIPRKDYDTTYLFTTTRPPGNLLGLFESLYIELQFPLQCDFMSHPAILN